MHLKSGCLELCTLSHPEQKSLSTGFTFFSSTESRSGLPQIFLWHRKSSVLKWSVRGCLTLTDHNQFEWAAKSPRNEMLILSISSGSSAHLQIRWSQSPPTSGSADTNNCANRFATHLHLPALTWSVSQKWMEIISWATNLNCLNLKVFTGAFVVHLKATRQPHPFFLFDTGSVLLWKERHHQI